MYGHIKPILISSIDDNAPNEALFQARDIFETIYTAGQKNGHIPKIVVSTESERQWIRNMLKAHHIDEGISFQTLLGCADKLLNTPGEENFFQARCLFRILLNAL